MQQPYAAISAEDGIATDGLCFLGLIETAAVILLCDGLEMHAGEILQLVYYRGFLYN